MNKKKTIVAVATYTNEGLKFQMVLGPLKFEPSKRGRKAFTAGCHDLNQDRPKGGFVLPEFAVRCPCDELCDTGTPLIPLPTNPTGLTEFKSMI